MRLIDADEFKRQIAAAAIKNGILESANKATVMFELIDLQPTAYDMEEVVQQLEKEMKSYQAEHAWNYAKGLEYALEIVRNGGREQV